MEARYFLTQNGESRISKGEKREKIVGTFLRNYLPKNWGISTGEVFNQDGLVSRQVDIIIYDYSRPALRDADLKLFPVGSVLATCEVKTTLDKERLDEAVQNIQSVKSLVTGRKQEGVVPTHPPYGMVFAFDGSSDKTDTVVATMPVGITPAEVAYDPSNGEVFVANGINDTVSVISDATNTVVATVSVGSFPFGVAYDSFRGEVFVTNEDVPPNSNGTVSVIADLTAIAASGSPGASSWTYAGAAAGVAVIVAVAAYYTTSRGRSKPSATPALW